MTFRLTRISSVFFVAAVAALATSCTAEDTSAGEAVASIASNDAAAPVVHSSDAEIGRTLFVEKGCVICHSVNGVGGKAAAALDAVSPSATNDPLEFAARMWRGAPAMVELQSLELGYVIWLTSADIANLAAFASDLPAQKELTIDDLPQQTRDGLLDQRFWEAENWTEFLSDGQEGAGEPAAPADEENPN